MLHPQSDDDRNEGEERVQKHTAYFSGLPKPTLSRGMGVVCLNEQNGSVMLNSGACATAAAGFRLAFSLAPA